MKIDFATLAFGYTLESKGGTPNWATSLGQGKGYKINENTEMDNILKGLIYKAVPLSKVKTKIGKGGKYVFGDDENSPIILSSMFEKVYINDILINDGQYIILITRDDSKSHYGRLRFKYGPSNEYKNNEISISNKEFWDKVKLQLGFGDDACLFVYDISVRNQDELIMKTIFVNKTHGMVYKDNNELHAEWDKLIEADEQNNLSIESDASDKNTIENIDLSEERKLNFKNCLDINRKPRKDAVHPMNFIVYGAPGTGKTYSMVEYALSIIDNIEIEEFTKNNKDRKINIYRYKELVKSGQIVFTTFHQNYGYEEFIQGLRIDKDRGNLSFSVVNGIFKTISDRALNDTENKNYIIIIDEINRANISKVFGELITLIEEDKRWGEINETSATLQSGEIFAVPNNLYIIGTMNSADKSISLIDAALRRRFKFIEQRPDASLVPEGILRDIFNNINENLVKELDSTDLLVGHSYFMNKTEKDLCDILNNNIIPLLYEYFYDNRKKVESLLKDTINKSGAKIEIYNEKVGRLRVELLEG